VSIVLNEREWAENAITSRQLGKKPVETLSRVARYYCQCEKYKKKEVRGKLEDFLLQCDPGVILVKWSDTIDRIVRSSDKFPLIELEGIDITEAELQTVRSLDGKQLQRLAFTLLCVAKYWDAAQEKNNGWVNTSDKEIMKMANINTSIKRQSLMLHEMKNAGLLRFSKRVDSLNIQVKFIRANSPVAIHITDFRNLGNQYLLYCGEPYFQCANCGLTIKKKSNVHKYCSDCAAEMYIKKSVESVMRQRRAAE
jgi:hypothetical protein